MTVGVCIHGGLRRSCEACDLADRLEAIQGLVKEQAEDEGLWFIARTAPEAYLQQALRELHALIEKAL